MTAMFKDGSCANGAISLRRFCSGRNDTAFGHGMQACLYSPRCFLIAIYLAASHRASTAAELDVQSARPCSQNLSELSVRCFLVALR